MATKPPQVPCVPVSTTETQSSQADISSDARYGMTLSEQAAIRHLTVNCGWITLEPGVIRRPWRLRDGNA